MRADRGGSAASLSFLSLIEELGVRLDAGLLDLALTHRSYAYEHGQIPNNERLEFLGDSVLGVIVTQYLYCSFPDYAEGQLAKLRASVVSAVSLAEVARELKIGPMIKLGKGELSTGGANKGSILADTTEALIGAVFLSGGREAAETLVHHIFDPLVDHAATLGAGLDWKTSLQETAAAIGLGPTVFDIEESGPDHDKRFVAWAVFGGRRFGPGKGRNKKHAEQEAAAVAYQVLAAEQIAGQPAGGDA
ncbi:ribonuclease III [Brooklawnia sp.]|uniref:ribonuclease III n=1 Tax=Brooklawnia sp. TaxID=2699740 RepID=UPI00311ED2FB